MRPEYQEIDQHAGGTKRRPKTNLVPHQCNAGDLLEPVVVFEGCKRSGRHPVLKETRRIQAGDPARHFPGKSEVTRSPGDFLSNGDQSPCGPADRAFTSLKRRRDVKIDTARKIKAPVDRGIDSSGRGEDGHLDRLSQLETGHGERSGENHSMILALVIRSPARIWRTASIPSVTRPNTA